MNTQEIRNLYNEVLAHRNNLVKIKAEVTDSIARFDQLIHSLDATATRLEVKKQIAGGQ